MEVIDRASGDVVYASGQLYRRPIARDAIWREAEVSELAQACGGDASTLLAKLRDGSVSRFRSDKATQLQEYLEQEGYLDTQPSVPEVDALPRVMGALAKNLEADDITEDRIAEIVASIYGFQDVNPR